jgi:hypothetical protein
VSIRSDVRGGFVRIGILLRSEEKNCRGDRRIDSISIDVGGSNVVANCAYLSSRNDLLSGASDESGSPAYCSIWVE